MLPSERADGAPVCCHLLTALSSTEDGCQPLRHPIGEILAVVVIVHRRIKRDVSQYPGIKRLAVQRRQERLCLYGP